MCVSDTQFQYQDQPDVLIGYRMNDVLQQDYDNITFQHEAHWPTEVNPEAPNNNLCQRLDSRYCMTFT